MSTQVFSVNSFFWLWTNELELMKEEVEWQLLRTKKVNLKDLKFEVKLFELVQMVNLYNQSKNNVYMKLTSFKASC